MVERAEHGRVFDRCAAAGNASDEHGRRSDPVTQTATPTNAQR
jgi:hypothetical protein